MGNGKNDFVLDSKGHCFLCLNNVCAVKHELESVVQPHPKNSFYYLSRYLKMDLKKVFNNAEHIRIPSELLAKVANSRLKVELCEECVNLTEQFSKNYRNLERAEMELGSCLKRIHAKFLDADETLCNMSRKEEFKRLKNVEPHLKLDYTGELEILEVLREEAFKKSHNKLRAAGPRVKFRNLRKKDITKKQLEYKSDKITSKEPQKTLLPVSSFNPSLNSSNTQVLVHANDVKMEVETPDAFTASDDGDGNCSMDDSMPYHEAVSDDAEDTLLNVDEQLDYINTNRGKTFPSLDTKIPRKSRTEVRMPSSIIVQETGKHKCGTCSKEFSTKPVFQQHYESIHLKVRFKCATCGKQFSSQRVCDRHHKSVHVGVRYACQVCNKSFKRTDHVRLHQRATDCGKRLGLGSL